MKKILTVLLMFVAMSSFAQKSKFVWGYFKCFHDSHVIYYKYYDGEDKQVNVCLLNTKTNKTDSLRAIEAKIVDNALFYCDCETIKKRNLSSESVNGDSVIYSSPFDIENFYIDNGNLLVTEIDSSYEKVNIKYYVDGICSFRESVPCIPQELEYQIVQIFPLEDCFAITVQGDLFIFDKKKKELKKILENCIHVDSSGNIYYGMNSETDFSNILYVANINDLSKKIELIKYPHLVFAYNYICDGKNKGCFIIGEKLFELENMKIRQILNVRFSEEKGNTVTYNPKEGYFILEY